MHGSRKAIAECRFELAALRNPRASLHFFWGLPSEDYGKKCDVSLNYKTGRIMEVDETQTE
jgi:hypothetical protein